MPRIVDHAKKREHFAKAAYDVISAVGFEEATLRKVAEKAGYTTGALVHYLKSKEDVLLAAFQHTATKTAQQFAKEEARRSPIEAFWHVLHWSLPGEPVMTFNWLILFKVWQHITRNPSLRVLYRERNIEWQGQLAHLLRRAQEAGEIPRDADVMKIVRTATALIEGLAIQALVAHPGNEIARLHQIIDNWLAKALRPRTSKKLRWLGVSPAAE